MTGETPLLQKYDQSRSAGVSPARCPKKNRIATHPHPQPAHLDTVLQTF